MSRQEGYHRVVQTGSCQSLPVPEVRLLVGRYCSADSFLSHLNVLVISWNALTLFRCAFRQKKLQYSFWRPGFELKRRFEQKALTRITVCYDQLP